MSFCLVADVIRYTLSWVNKQGYTRFFCEHTKVPKHKGYGGRSVSLFSLRSIPREFGTLVY